jgi:hypothetical protein
METADARKLVMLVERGVAALERMATALEQANAADPLQMMPDALAAEQNQPVSHDADMPEYIRRAVEKQP